jgi:hypothetical protein
MTLIGLALITVAVFFVAIIIMNYDYKSDRKDSE